MTEQTGRLTTHVLDLASGRPAGGVRIELRRLGTGSEGSGSEELLLTTRTNADGRGDAPLLQGASLLPGRYSLSFYVADYFRAAGVALADPPFIDDVVIRFGIAAADQHYHVPLLVSPWSYSTYRGS